MKNSVFLRYHYIYKMAESNNVYKIGNYDDITNFFRALFASRGAVAAQTGLRGDVDHIYYGEKLPNGSHNLYRKFKNITQVTPDGKTTIKTNLELIQISNATWTGFIYNLTGKDINEVYKERTYNNVYYT